MSFDGQNKQPVFWPWVTRKTRIIWQRSCRLFELPVRKYWNQIGFGHICSIHMAQITFRAVQRPLHTGEGEGSDWNTCRTSRQANAHTKQRACSWDFVCSFKLGKVFLSCPVNESMTFHLFLLRQICFFFKSQHSTDHIGLQYTTVYQIIICLLGRCTFLDLNLISITNDVMGL